MLFRLFVWLTSISPAIKEWLWKRYYQKLSSSKKEIDWRFMNYGYTPIHNEPLLTLNNEEDEKNRLFIQLYHHILSDIEIKDKKVLDVGSGRGGGTDYIARYLAPSSIIGVDFAKNSIDLCNQFYHNHNLSFVVGNAEKLPFSNDHFDVILNVESSHCYGNMEAFVVEINRILKPGGIFAWTDLRTAIAMEQDDDIFMNCPLKLLLKKNITPNIIQALNQVSDQAKEKNKERVSFWRSLIFEFKGLRNSKIYRCFEEGTMGYFYYRFQKPLMKEQWVTSTTVLKNP